MSKKCFEIFVQDHFSSKILFNLKNPAKNLEKYEFPQNQGLGAWMRVYFPLRPQGVQIFLKWVQKSQPGQLPVRISPSSDGVERKIGYVGLPTHRVLSRRLIFRVILEMKIFFRCRTKKVPDSGKSGKELSGWAL